MDREFARAAGAWHAEWEIITDLLRLAGGAAGRLAQSLSGLKVYPDAMARNLEATGGAPLAERVTATLSAHTESARDIVIAAIRSGRALDAGPVITEFLTAAVVRELLSPAACVGHAGDIVDRVLNARSNGQGP